VRSAAVVALGIAAVLAGCGDESPAVDEPTPRNRPAALIVQGTGAPVEVPAAAWCPPPAAGGVPPCAIGRRPNCASPETVQVPSGAQQPITVTAAAGVDGLQGGNVSVTHGRTLTLPEPEAAVTVITRPGGVDYAVYLFCVARDG
jgi:hypothetical protein